MITLKSTGFNLSQEQSYAGISTYPLNWAGLNNLFNLVLALQYDVSQIDTSTLPGGGTDGQILWLNFSGNPAWITPTLASQLFGNQGTAHTVLHGNVAGNPSWSAINLAADVSGNLPIGNLNGGTGASSTTYWQGDGTWGTPAGTTYTANTGLTLSTNAFSISDTGVTAGSYTNANITVNAQGQVTTVSNGSSGGTSFTHTILVPSVVLPTVNLVDNAINIINPAGALSSTTLNFPSSPSNNDFVFVKFTKAITTISYSGGTVVGQLATAVAGSTVLFTYDSATTSWY